MFGAIAASGFMDARMNMDLEDLEDYGLEALLSRIEPDLRWSLTTLDDAEKESQLAMLRALLQHNVSAFPLLRRGFFASQSGESGTRPMIRAMFDQAASRSGGRLALYNLARTIVQMVSVLP